MPSIALPPSRPDRHPGKIGDIDPAIGLLAPHLEAEYGIGVRRLVPLEPWAPDGVQRVDRIDGPAWVARVLPPERPTEQAEADVEVLRYLEANSYPAERCAHPRPLSVLNGRAVVVTKLLPGRNARDDQTIATATAVGELVGRLHTLPPPEGPIARPAAGWHHLSPVGGGRRADVDALAPMLDAAARRLDEGARAGLATLRAELEAIDGCEDLPQAFVNCDLVGPNVIVAPDGSASVVDWTGAGRGPRVHSLVAMCVPRRELVDGFIAGYRRHGDLRPEELDRGRLANALAAHSLILDAYMFAKGFAPLDAVLARRRPARQLAEDVADRARRAFAAWR